MVGTDIYHIDFFNIFNLKYMRVFYTYNKHCHGYEIVFPGAMEATK